MLRLGLELRQKLCSSNLSYNVALIDFLVCMLAHWTTTSGYLWLCYSGRFDVFLVLKQERVGSERELLSLFLLLLLALSLHLQFLPWSILIEAFKLLAIGGHCLGVFTSIWAGCFVIKKLLDLISLWLTGCTYANIGSGGLLLSFLRKAHCAANDLSLVEVWFERT